MEKPGGIKPNKPCKGLEELQATMEKMKQQKEMGSISQNDDVDPNQVLAKAYDEVKTVVIAGFDKAGEYYFASSVADGTEIVWLLEKMKHRLMSMGSSE